MKNLFLLKSFILVSAFAATANSGDPVKPTQKIAIEKAWTLTGLDNPESVAYDSKEKILYVSSVNGSPGAVDGNGYISKVSLDGKLIKKDWIVGLDAPKGMAISKGKLYVSDINKVVEIDIAKGTIVKKHEVKNATFLNDVTADKAGDIYISNTWGADASASAIFKLSQGVVTEWLKDTKLNAPNGLLAEGGYIYVVSWGEGLDPATFKSNTPGKLLRVNKETKSIEVLKDRIGNLDGIVKAKNGLYFSDYLAGKVFFTPDEKTVNPVLGGLPMGSADIEINKDQDMLYIPINSAKEVIAYKIKK